MIPHDNEELKVFPDKTKYSWPSLEWNTVTILLTVPYPKWRTVIMCIPKVWPPQSSHHSPLKSVFHFVYKYKYQLQKIVLQTITEIKTIFKGSAKSSLKRIYRKLNRGSKTWLSIWPKVKLPNFYNLSFRYYFSQNLHDNRITMHNFNA